MYEKIIHTALAEGKLFVFNSTFLCTFAQNLKYERK
jgi:hypothetical protein